MPCYYKPVSAFLCSLLLCSICLAESSISVDLYRRDSRHSPSYDPSSTRSQRLRSAFDRSFSRKSSLVASSLASTDSVEAPISPSGGAYLMKIMIGTPPVEQLGIADTGSDLTWIQCEPCTRCFEQTLPTFDPSKTSSYEPVSCDSDQCAAPGTRSCGSNNNCQYKVMYGDQRSYSSGELAAETLTFDGGVSFPKVAFGCGHDNSGNFNPTESGIVGLGGGSLSIVNQLQSSIGGRFSYCLTLLNSGATSRITFGSSAVVAGPNVVSTPLVRKSRPTFYYITLEGLSVGTERLDYTAAGASAEEGNIIIDSGTTLTFIPAELYGRVESALESAVKGTRVADPQGANNMCYEIGGLSSPPITAHFKGADLILPQENIFVELEEGIACLTLIPSRNFNILGNLHQMNYHIGFDLVKEEVSFLPTDCSKP